LFFRIDRVKTLKSAMRSNDLKQSP
jgi:hypothetical protein